MVTLILGAGFSKWAANLPVAKDLFDFAVEPFGVREEKTLCAVRKLKASWDLAHPREPAEAFIDFATNQSPETSKMVVWYVVRRLSDPYVWKEWHAGKWRRHVLMLDEHRKNKRPGVQEARDFLVGVLGALLQGVITTNYDLLIEYAFGTKGFNYGVLGELLVGRGPYPVSTWLHRVVLTGPVSVAKVHGLYYTYIALNVHNNKRLVLINQTARVCYRAALPSRQCPEAHKRLRCAPRRSAPDRVGRV